MKLKVLTRGLRVVRGSQAKSVGQGQWRIFLVGSNEQCHVCCDHPSIRPIHCALHVASDRVLVQDLESGEGTFVNGQLVQGEHVVAMGDRLKVGVLELSLLTDTPANSAGRAAGSPSDSQKDEPADGGVSDWLMDADEAERARRLADPELRTYKLDTPHTTAISEDEVMVEKLPEPKPKKKPPGKLPPPAPLISGKDSIEAANESLKLLFGSNFNPPLKTPRGGPSKS